MLDLTTVKSVTKIFFLKYCIDSKLFSQKLWRNRYKYENKSLGCCKILRITDARVLHKTDTLTYIYLYHKSVIAKTPGPPIHYFINICK